MIRRLGLKQSGGTHLNIRRWIKVYGLDVNHFDGPGRRTGPRKVRRTASVVLSTQPHGRRWERALVLRRALISIGVKHVCASCGTLPVWQGKPLTLQVDHVNGDKHNNQRENLRFMCPNCHSQTDTFGSKNCARVAQLEDATP